MRYDVIFHIAFTHEVTLHEICVYMTQDVAVEASYKVHKNDYWHDKQ